MHNHITTYDSRKYTRKISLCVVVSVAVHLLSFVQVSQISNWLKSYTPQSIPEKINVRIVSRPEPLLNKKENPLDDLEDKRVLENKLEKTAPPVDAKYLSHQDHATERETRVKPRIESKLKDAGDIEKSKSKAEAKSAKRTQQESAPDMQKKLKLTPMTGDIPIFSTKRDRPQTAYEKLLPQSSDLQSRVAQGYQQHLDESIDLGEVVNMNTSEFRYVGYFTAMRKAIELVWNYPSEAARKGMQGIVQMEFVISKKGQISRIRVVRSSGYKILDDAVVEALKLASPFSPLPDGFGKENLAVSYGFLYQLTPYASGH